MAGEKSNQATFPEIVSQPVRWEGTERLHPAHTAVMNQTIWAVQDFILDAVKSGLNKTGLTKNAIAYILKSNHVGHRALQDFLGKSWASRIQTALELRKLEAG